MALSTAIGTLIFPKVQTTAIGNLLTTSTNIKQPSNDNGTSPLKERQDSYDHQKENGKNNVFMAVKKKTNKKGNENLDEQSQETQEQVVDYEKRSVANLPKCKRCLESSNTNLHLPF